MDIVENHRIKLLNAKCEVVCQAEYLMKKLQNGDDIECCTKKLFTAIKLINRLDCYCFTSPAISINGEVTFTIQTELLLPFDGSYFILANGSYIGPVRKGLETTTVEEMINDLLENNTIGLTYTVEETETNVVFTINTTCEYFNISFYGEPDGGGELYVLYPEIISEPVCVDAVTCNNCTTDADLSKYYQVLDNLLR